jgi:hypothetical protein
MNMRKFQSILTFALILSSSLAYGQSDIKSSEWQDEFGLSKRKLLTTGQNQYFVLEPGYQMILEGGGTKLQITVLDETKTVDGVVTRVVEEREWKGGELHEVARNYYAICEQTKDVFYFGEDVDHYENGKVVKHDGSWLAGSKGNKAGLMMAGNPKVGMKYYQEIAPEVEMDRTEVVSLDETCETHAGTFSKCLKAKVGSAMEPLVTEYKYYAPGIGLVMDQDLLLVKHGFVKM